MKIREKQRKCTYKRVRTVFFQCESSVLWSHQRVQEIAGVRAQALVWTAACSAGMRSQRSRAQLRRSERELLRSPVQPSSTPPCPARAESPSSAPTRAGGAHALTANEINSKFLNSVPISQHIFKWIWQCAEIFKPTRPIVIFGQSSEIKPDNELLFIIEKITFYCKVQKALM